MDKEKKDVVIQVCVNYESHTAEVRSNSRKTEDFFIAARHILIAGAQGIRSRFDTDIDYERAIAQLFMRVAMDAAQSAVDDEIKMQDFFNKNAEGKQNG